MKKLLCMVLVLCSLSGAVFGIASNAQTAANQSTAEKFASDVGSLIAASEISNSMPGRESGTLSSEYEEFKTARLIVKSKQKINILDAVSVVSGYENLWVLQFKNPEDAAEAYKYYSTKSGIEFVEADKEVSVTSSSSSASFAQTSSESEYLSWGPAHIGFDRFKTSIYENNLSLTDVVVAVVDTGVDPNHPFLEGRVIPTKINTSTSGIRNNSMDDCGHGTQVAGVIADCSLDNVYIKPYKVLNSSGNGTVITVAAGINCAVKDGVDVINISVGFEEESEVLKAAVDNAENNDITVIAAAGNDGSNTAFYPASYSNVIKVSAINESDVIANFSTYGEDMDFAAPGVDIKTTTLNNEYSYVRGTSFAAPFVSAVAACILTILHDVSPEDIKECLAVCVHKVSDFDSEQKYGNGVVNFPYLDEAAIPTEKTSTPYFSQENAFYSKAIELEIFCDTPNSTIYYTTDRTTPSKNNPAVKIYDGSPIPLSETTVIMAVAYSEGKYRSSIASFNSIIAPIVSENELVVDSSGNLLSYSGNSTSITIPRTVNEITVTAVGENAFAGSGIVEVILPTTVTSIKAKAFENCTQLRTVAALNATVIGERAFYNCQNLRNPYLGELKSIGKYSFYNVCRNEYNLYGRTFKLQLENLIMLPEGAFMGSALSVAEFNKIISVGKNVFSECTALVSVYFNSMSAMPNGMFKGCTSLVDVDIYNCGYISVGAFSTCENLLSVDMPDATYVNSNAFENCVSLTEVILSKAGTVYSNAFSGCTSLKTLNLPSMLQFEPEVYTSGGNKITLPQNLETFKAPMLTRTVTDMFSTAKNSIKNILLNSVTEVAEYTFRGCHNIYFLNLKSVKTLDENALEACTIQFIDARQLETSESMPDNSGILLSNNFIESTDKAENLTVYGTPGTFVERYAKYKEYAFVPIPLIVNSIPKYVTENSETVFVFAIGFDLTYQWYWNTVNSTEGGTPIDGATTNSYTFTESDTAPYYYCVITQRDMETVSVIKTNVIIKDTTPADYSGYETAVEKANAIDRSLYENIYLLDEALSVDVSQRYSCEQEIVDAQTDAILQAIASLKLKSAKTITLYASETDLSIFESVRIIPAIYPIDAIYEGVEWSCSDSDILLVSKNGYIRCIGDGMATVYAKITNPDGTKLTASITIDCDLTFFEKLIGFLFKPIFIISFNLYY